mgnify:CR=1 FL=1
MCHSFVTSPGICTAPAAPTAAAAPAALPAAAPAAAAAAAAPADAAAAAALHLAVAVLVVPDHPDMTGLVLQHHKHINFQMRHNL